MKLLTKGLVVIATPLVLQVLLVNWLIAEFSRIQNQTAEVGRSREIAACADTLFTSTVQEQLLSGVGGGLNKSGDVRDEQLKSGLERLRVLSVGDYSRITLESDLERAANVLLATSRKLQKEKRIGLKNHVNVYFTHSLVSDLVTFFEAATKLMDCEQNNARRGFEETNQLIQQTLSWIACFWAFSVLLSMLLGWLYVSTIRKPLLLLQQNAMLLAQRKALLPLSSQTDEIVSLDQIIKEASRELNRALSHELEVVAKVSAVLCSLDNQDRFTSVNQFVERLFGATPEILINRSVYEFINDDDIAKADGAFSAARSSNARRTVDLKTKRMDGGIVETTWSMDYQKDLGKIFCVIFDITETKNLEKTRETFIDMVGSEIQKPLISVQRVFDSIARGEHEKLSSDVLEEIQSCSRSVQRLENLIANFLQFHKFRDERSALDLAQHSLRKIVIESIAENDLAAQLKQIRIVQRAFETSVTCDRIKVTQVLNNLLSNAIKFSPPGSEIVIFITSQRDFTFLCVADQGPGIPINFRNKIFEPYEQIFGESTGKGAGLGLAICKMITDAHGWILSAESRIDGTLSKNEPSMIGSVFAIRIPNADLYGQIL